MFLHGLMAEDMKANILMIREKDKEFTIGPSVKSITAPLKTEYNTAQAP